MNAFPWCVMQVPLIDGKEKGAIMADAKWPRGSIIKIAFMDGDKALQDLVWETAGEWLVRTGADLSFERRKDPTTAHARVSFRYKGFWSVLGRYAQSAPKTDATMNFGWLHPTSSDEPTSIDEAARGVVLHEFGHLLGFIHEHQNPDGGLRWKRDVVMAELSGPPNSWSPAQIERNVLSQYDPREVIGTPFDPDSIMLYPFPAEWNENGIATHANSDLSGNDIALARDVYT